IYVTVRCVFPRKSEYISDKSLLLKTMNSNGDKNADVIVLDDDDEEDGGHGDKFDEVEDISRLDLFPCKICGEYFSCSFTLSVHNEIHIKEQKSQKKINKKSLCKDCGKSLLRCRCHVKDTQNSVCNLAYQCEICNKCFESDTLLVEHHKLHNGMGYPKCLDCNKFFITKRSLLRHLYIHFDNNQQFTCDICNDSYQTQVDLDEHKLKHINNNSGKPHENETSIESSSNDSSSKRRPSGENDFECIICGETFDLIDQLVEHKKTHTVQKMYSCDVCEKSFLLRCALLSHKRSHNNYKCQSCQRTFLKKKEYSKH
ncbi:zinc finger protein 836-like, partial [Argonauta hians]